MLKKSLIAGAVIATLGAPGIVLADDSPHTFSANVGLFSQYIFRGLTQTDREPAIQGGFDYSYNFGPASLYVGTWGSNISWLRDGGSYMAGGSLESDWYGGVRGNFGKSDFTYDVGVLYYWYPGDAAPGFIRANTTELYGALGYKWASVKYSYSLGDTFGVADADGTWYLDFSLSVPFGDTGLTGFAHYGIQKYEGTAFPGVADNDTLFSYNDYKIGVSYALPKNFTLGAYWTDTSGADPFGYGSTSDCGVYGCGVYPHNIADGQFTVYLQRTF